MTVDDAIVQQPEQKPVNPARAISFSREDEAAIRALADELHAPREIIAEIYGGELEPLREKARVTTFLPLVVSRRVRRQQRDARLSHWSRANTSSRRRGRVRRPGMNSNEKLKRALLQPATALFIHFDKVEKCAGARTRKRSRTMRRRRARRLDSP
jgi:hypothetical protein